MEVVDKNSLLDGLFGGDSGGSKLGALQAIMNGGKSAGDEIVMLPLNLIDDLSSFEHPFEKTLRLGLGIEELAGLIKSAGQIQPIIVRSKNGGRYEVISGHRRKRAMLMNGESNIKAIIKDLNDDEAQLICVDNLGQREEILPSEKAKAYKMQLEAIKRQGLRTDLTSVQLGQKLNARDVVAKEAGSSAVQIQRYIRLNELIPPLLDRVDEKLIGLTIAYELSYLKSQEQEALEMVLSENPEIKITSAIAKELRDAAEEMELAIPIIEAVLKPADAESDINKDFVPRLPKPAYKEAFKGLERQFKTMPPGKAEKLALCTKEVLEEVISEAIDKYLERLQ